jgi:hypothetical protein
MITIMNYEGHSEVNKKAAYHVGNDMGNRKYFSDGFDKNGQLICQQVTIEFKGAVSPSVL